MNDILKNSPIASVIESDKAPSVDINDDQNKNNRQVLAEVLLEYAEFSKSSESGLDHDDADLLRVKAENLRKCGSDYIKFDCLKAGCEHSFMLGQHCKSRVCPDCSSYKRRNWRDKYLPYLEKVNPSELRFITLTLRNQKDLHGGMGKIIRCFKKLRLKKMAECFKGGLVGYEAHHDKDGLWNIHCHALYHGKYIDQVKLSETWKEIAGWAKKHNHLELWQRRLAFTIGKYNKNSWPLSIKQARQGEIILNEVEKLGFKRNW